MENNKIELDSQTSNNKNEGSSRFYLALTVVIIFLNLLLFGFASTLEPGSGMAFIFLAPFIWVSWVIAIGIFIWMSIKYSREKSSMHYLDKITFYILLAILLFSGVPAIYKVSSGNIIKELLIDRQQRNEREVALVDLTVKDINYTYNNLINIKFCNDAKIQRSSFAGFFSISIKSDKNSNVVLRKGSAPIAGGCTEEIVSPSSLGLGIGDTASITVIMDSENEIAEITKENNKMTKKIILGRRQGECLETDEGRDFYKKGMVNGSLDCCKKNLSDPECPSQGQYIIENYCENEKPLKETYECPNGCTDGACVE